MAGKGLKELVKWERPRHMHRDMPQLYDIERWFEEAWKKPFSFIGPSFWPEVRSDERYELSPSVDIFEEGNDMVMKAELAGVKKEELKIDLTENLLTISGEKKKKEKLEREGYYRIERTYGSFCRRFELPGDLDTEKIKAHFEDGVLEVRIPLKKEAEKIHKKISID